MIRLAPLRSAALFAALLLAACGGDTPQSGDLIVGIVLPMTGAQATYGEESKNGIDLAFAEIESQKGWKVPIKLVPRDEQSKPEAAGTAAKSLIDTAGAHVILGTVASGSTRKVFQECREAGVPGITPASTNDKITREGGPYCSRICFADSFQGSVLATFALEQGWKKATVVEDKSAPYAVGLSENFRKAFEAGGGSVTREFYEEKDTDYTNLVQNVANSAPEVIVVAGYYTQAGLMLKQAVGLWDGKPVIGGDGLDSPKLGELKGAATNPVYLTSHFAASDPNPAVQRFRTRYLETYKKEPGAMAALGYDIMFVLADAIQRCADPRDRAALAKAIASTRDVKVVTGSISLDNEDRTPLKAAVVLKLKDGGFEYFKTVSPN